MRSSIRKKKITQRAYSLLEILLVVFIIAVFSGMALPYFNNSTNNKKLEQEAKRLIDVIELAKAKASAGESDIPGCEIFRGYRILFDNPPTQYRLRTCCSNFANPAILCSFSVDKFYKVQTGMSYTFSPNLATPNNFIHFSNIKHGTTLTSSGVIKITNASINKCIPITVDPLGLVTEGAKQTPPC